MGATRFLRGYAWPFIVECGREFGLQCLLNSLQYFERDVIYQECECIIFPGQQSSSFQGILVNNNNMFINGSGLSMIMNCNLTRGIFIAKYMILSHCNSSALID